ncbi:hypothetical protein OEA41_000457 [Lepraria neglecta]|uniref:Uncharacterized protein n=1 Tax=Lepraria neglecta TaxID=209136 RepID=A0AAD9ZG98_9LECA|nr:hypothetical protein OEA41_000457 [Lepraria neglecta]
MIQDLQNISAVILRRAQPGNNSICQPVDFNHSLDLLVSFFQILLVNTDGIDPENTRLVFVTEVRQNATQVLSDGERSVPGSPNFDLQWFDSGASGVGESFENWDFLIHSQTSFVDQDSYALVQTGSLPNPFYTTGVQNIEKRYSSGGASPNKTPAAATKRGHSDQVTGNTDTTQGIGTLHHEEKFGEQKPDVSSYNPLVQLPWSGGNI